METKAEVWIPLTQGKVTVIDFEDFEKVRDYKWYYARCRKNESVRTNTYDRGKEGYMILHRFLMDAPPNFQVDHEDGNGLNNRRSSNLRLATNSQNQRNRKRKPIWCSSAWKGVAWRKTRKKWQAAIWLPDKKKICLGHFDNEIEAAKAYDAAARKYFGEYAALNFPAQKENQCSTNAGVAL